MQRNFVEQREKTNEKERRGELENVRMELGLKKKEENRSYGIVSITSCNLQLHHVFVMFHS